MDNQIAEEMQNEAKMVKESKNQLNKQAWIEQANMRYKYA